MWATLLREYSIDRDLAVPAERDARRFETEARGVGLAADRQHDLVGADRLRHCAA